MSKLDKKFSWLLAYTVFSLIILLLTNFIKDITDFKNYNLFAYKIKQWKIQEDSLQSDIISRHVIFRKAQDTLQDRKNYNRSFYFYYLNKSLKLDQHIKYNLVTVTDLIETKKNLELTKDEIPRLNKK